METLFQDGLWTARIQDGKRKMGLEKNLKQAAGANDNKTANPNQPFSEKKRSNH